MTELIVELYGAHLGVIREQRDSFDFHADTSAIDRFGLGSAILSFAVPLVPNPRTSSAALRRNFFDELLPEGRARSRLAGNALLSPDYTVGMLARYGRDVAGALQIWNPAAESEPRTPEYAVIDDRRIREILAEVATSPIGNTSARRMSSLAGVQDKIVLARVDGQWAEPLDGYPSTHIVKPIPGALPTVIFDEEYGARIARHLGLASHATWVETFDGITALVIERYDRQPDIPGGRLHQEDFNQALGFSGDAKYEAHGHAGLATIARTLRTTIGTGAVRDLLKLTTLSVAVGNLDMHAKNISVLHHPDGTAQLAPAYDVVPQTHQPFDQEFAFSVNGVTAHPFITRADLTAEGTRWGLRDAGDIVGATAESVRAFVREERPHPGAHFGLAADIERICTNLLDASRTVGGGDSSPPRNRRRASRAEPHEGGTAAAPLRDLPRSVGGWGGPG